jgi:ureidoglycolate dehydrogenase (NAD+)
VTAIAADELEGLAAAALRASGLPAEGSADVARVLVLADLFGMHTHGVSRIPQYVERARLGGIDLGAEIATEQVAPAVARVDGRNGIGPLVGMHALHAASAAALTAGIGAAFARASNHVGPVMPYLFLAAQDGLAAIVASNATTTIAPWGGREARLGNNPLGLGVPNPAGDPILLDVAMSVVARAKIRAAERAGEAIPDTWATDAGGLPTTDPRAALEGFLLPVGGHKGYGLALMVDLFAGVLSGASYLTRISSWSEDPERPQDLGHVFVLVDAERLAGRDALGRRVEDFAAILHGTPPADPDGPVQVPGERELASYRAGLRDGLELPGGDVEALRTLAGGGW